MQISQKKRPWEKSKSQGNTYTDTSIYRSTRWRKLREAKLRITPYCECQDCIGKNVKADMVDHIKRIEDGGDPWSMDNLQSMRNHPCHDRKRAKEKNEKYSKSNG